MRRYVIELTAAFLVYGVSLVLSSYLVGYHDLGVNEALWAALVPMPSTILVAWVIWRNLKLMDEMQRRVQAESLALALAITALITFNYGFLEGAGFPRQSAFWVWPIMGTSWIFAQIIVKRRY
ncbi:MAG: hypothetical protein AAGF71_15225 [Pseudomonadota bacterium]